MVSGFGPRAAALVALCALIAVPIAWAEEEPRETPAKQTAAAPAKATIDVGAKTTTYVALAHSGDQWLNSANYALTEIAQAEVKFSATNALKNLKAEIDLDATVGDSVTIDVPKAWVKARLGGFRLLVGKTRLTWGDGIFFNAGDLLFDSASAAIGSAALVEEELRTETALLSSAYVPLGTFSFAEFVLLPAAYPLGSSALPEAADTARFGARAQTKWIDIKCEAGALYEGDGGRLRPYLGAQGNLWADLYAVVAESIPIESPSGGDLRENLLISLGLFRMGKSGSITAPSLRLEALVGPDRAWTDGESTPYGLYLYPELTWTGNSLDTQLRAVISPIDTSAIASFGFRLHATQGLRFFAFAAAALGERGDVFDSNAAASSSLIVGVEGSW